MLALTNNLQEQELIRKLKLPLTKIGYGIIKGYTMYRFNKSTDTFIVPYQIKRKHSSNIVYATLYDVKYLHATFEILDDYHMCSLSRLNENHRKDVHHRVKLEITPIGFNTFDELIHQKYIEAESTLNLFTYVGNIRHESIYSRLNKTTSKRITNGFNTKLLNQGELL